MQGETDCSSSPLSVSSSLKLGSLRIRREDGLSFVPAWENSSVSVEGDEVSVLGCSC